MYWGKENIATKPCTHLKRSIYILDEIVIRLDVILAFTFGICKIYRAPFARSNMH